MRNSTHPTPRPSRPPADSVREVGPRALTHLVRLLAHQAAHEAFHRAEPAPKLEEGA